MVTDYLISYELFQKICNATGRTPLLQAGPLENGKCVGKMEVSTNKFGVIKVCVVKGVVHNCALGSMT